MNIYRHRYLYESNMPSINYRQISLDQKLVYKFTFSIELNGMSRIYLSQKLDCGPILSSTVWNSISPWMHPSFFNNHCLCMRLDHQQPYWISTTKFNLYKFKKIILYIKQDRFFFHHLFIPLKPLENFTSWTRPKDIILLKFCNSWLLLVKICNLEYSIENWSSYTTWNHKRKK